MRWPNGQLLHHRACPTHGYDLCYSAQPGESVTLFTARDGLRVRMVNGGEEGVLVQPVEISPASDGVVWRVVFSGGDRDGGMELTFLVSRLYAEPTWHATEEYETASELEVRASLTENNSGEHRMRASDPWVPGTMCCGGCKQCFWGTGMTVTRLLGCI